MLARRPNSLIDLPPPPQAMGFKGLGVQRRDTTPHTVPASWNVSGRAASAMHSRSAHSNARSQPAYIVGPSRLAQQQRTTGSAPHTARPTASYHHHAFGHNSTPQAVNWAQQVQGSYSDRAPARSANGHYTTTIKSGSPASAADAAMSRAPRQQRPASTLYGAADHKEQLHSAGGPSPGKDSSRQPHGGAVGEPTVEGRYAQANGQAAGYQSGQVAFEGVPRPVGPNQATLRSASPDSPTAVSQRIMTFQGDAALYDGRVRVAARPGSSARRGSQFIPGGSAAQKGTATAAARPGTAVHSMSLGVQ